MKGQSEKTSELGDNRFNGWYLPPPAMDPGDIPLENIVYVGCVHGGDEKFFARLDRLLSAPPQVLIFTGDLAGTEEMEELKRRFYNYVVNRAKLCLSLDPGGSDANLLNFGGDNASLPARNLQEGYLLLYQYLLELEGQTEQQTRSSLNALSAANIASAIRHLTTFPYYGNWAATLPAALRQKLLSGLEPAAKRIMQSLEKLRRLGTRIIMLEGNWDNAPNSGINIIAGPDLPASFDTRDFFIEQGIEFIDRITGIETQETFQIFLPFGVAEELHENFAEKIEPVKELCAAAKRAGRHIVLVGHAEPDLTIHNLFAKITKTSRARALLVENFDRIIAALHPDEVIYSHQHNPIQGAQGELIDPNAKYFLRVEPGKNGVRLVTDLSELQGRFEQPMVTYLPLRKFARLAIPAGPLASGPLSIRVDLS